MICWALQKKQLKLLMVVGRRPMLKRRDQKDFRQLSARKKGDSKESLDPQFTVHKSWIDVKSSALSFQLTSGALHFIQFVLQLFLLNS